jgi:GTP-binding protein
VVVAINKWDAVDSYQRQMLERSIEQPAGLPEVCAGAAHLGIKRQGLGPLWKAIDEAHASATARCPRRC